MKPALAGLVNGQASKFLVSLLTTVSAALPLYFSGARWEPLAVMAAGAVVTWLVPNAPKDAPVPQAPPAEPPAGGL